MPDTRRPDDRPCGRTSGDPELSITTAEGPRTDDIGGDLSLEWGMHLVDENVAMGDLTDLVQTQSASPSDCRDGPGCRPKSFAACEDDDQDDVGGLRFTSGAVVPMNHLPCR